MQIKVFQDLFTLCAYCINSLVFYSQNRYFHEKKNTTSIICKLSYPERERDYLGVSSKASLWTEQYDESKTLGTNN